MQAHEHPLSHIVMLESPFALVGVVLQWGTGLLLCLLFYRLGRVGTHRRMLWTWSAAWGGQVMAVTGFAIEAIAALTGRPLADAGLLQWLDGLYAPGTMLFMALLAMGAVQTAGRHVSFAAERWMILAAPAAGILAVLLGDMITGVLLVIASAAAVMVGCARILRAERRAGYRRLLLPVAIVLVGAVMISHQLIRYFAGTLDPFGDFTGTLLTATGYTSAVASAILGAAVIVIVTEDGFRARQYVQQERIRELASSQALLESARRSMDEMSRAGAEAAARSVAPSDAAPAPRIASASAGAPQPSRPASDMPAPLRAPPLTARTATLPRPARRADGTSSEALVVDHEATARASVARIFQRGGWGVREAATGAEALTWLLGVDRQDAPAVILCEFRMQGLGGRELYAHLQQQRPEFLGRLIFVGNDLDQSTAEFIRASQCEIIHRPVAVEELARAMEQVSSWAD